MNLNRVDKRDPCHILDAVDYTGIISSQIQKRTCRFSTSLEGVALAFGVHLPNEKFVPEASLFYLQWPIKKSWECPILTTHKPEAIWQSNASKGVLAVWAANQKSGTPFHTAWGWGWADTAPPCKTSSNLALAETCSIHLTQHISLACNTKIIMGRV